MSTPPEKPDRTRNIFALMLDGRSLRDIASLEGVTVRRVQQIVAAELARREANPANDYKLLQIARLEQSLDMLGAAIDSGKVSAVTPYLRVVEALGALAGKQLYLSTSVFRGKDDAAELSERLDRLAAAREVVAERRAARLAKQNAPQAAENKPNGEIENFAGQ